MAFEALYEYVEDNLVGAVMHGKIAAAWFPYILTLFLFILFSNLIGLVPFFLGIGEFGGVSFPAFRTYAATSNINVTVALALLTFLLTHVSGIRANGPIGYFKGWVPGSAPGVLKPVLFVIHFFSEIFRLLSLAVRLYANLLAGHIMILVFYALIFMLPSVVFLVILSPLIERACSPSFSSSIRGGDPGVYLCHPVGGLYRWSHPAGALSLKRLPAGLEQAQSKSCICHLILEGR